MLSSKLGRHSATPTESSSTGPIADRKNPEGPIVNGFYTLPELPALVVQEANIAPLSLPLEALTFKPTGNNIVYHFKNKDRERKIYCNIEFDPHEKELLKQLQAEAKRQNLEFLPSITVMAMRFMSRARGDIQRCLNLMAATQNFRLEHFKNGPVTDLDVIDDMKHGIVYFCGRDSSLRPAIVVRCARVPKQWFSENRIDKLLRLLIFCMEYMIRYMVVPGKIENNCLIVDLKGVAMSQVSIGPLKEIYGVMSHHYIGRVFKFYICNLVWPLSTLAGLATNLLTDRQKQKLVMVDNVKDLQKEFALHQLEDDLGGVRPQIKEFFPFPLLGGPFEAGSSCPPDPNAVPRMHTLITSAGFSGHLWDPSRSKISNLAVEYTPEAPKFFVSQGLPIPPDCLIHQRDATKNGIDDHTIDGEHMTVDPTSAGDTDLLVNESKPVHTNVDTTKTIEEDKPAVKPAGFFSCGACFCHQNP